MITQDANFEFPASVIRFQVPGNEKPLELDVVEAEMAIGQIASEATTESEYIAAVQKWIVDQGCDITTAHTYVLILAVQEAWEEFKKKLPEALQLRITTNSTPQPLVSERSNVSTPG